MYSSFDNPSSGYSSSNRSGEVHSNSSFYLVFDSNGSVRIQVPINSAKTLTKYIFIPRI